MSHLLISLLGDSRDRESNPGPSLVRYCLPGGKRNVETAHLGIELASALQVQKLVLAGPPGAPFDQLLDLLSKEEARAPVAETLPPRAAPAPAAASVEEPAAEPEKDEAVPKELLPPVEDSPAKAAPQAALPDEDQLPSTPGAGEEAAPPACSDTEEKEAPPPAEASNETAPEGEDSRPSHRPDPRSLLERLQDQQQHGRVDQAALNALGERLARALKLEEVRCLTMSVPVDDHSFQAALLELLELPETGDLVDLNVTHGNRNLPLLATLALHYLGTLRQDVQAGELFMATPEHTDKYGVVPVQSLKAPLRLLEWMTAFESLREGAASQKIHQLLNKDSRLQALAGPYVRFQRGLQFGALSETRRGALALQERQGHLERLPYSHSFKIFSPVMQETLGAFTQDEPPSRTQLRLASWALRAGHLPRAALHLREAMFACCLELFGQNPARVWVEVPESGGTQEVRNRDVADYILTLPAAKETCHDLAIVWPVLREAQRQYGHIPSANIPASLLKQASHEISQVMKLTCKLIEENGLKGLEEGRTFAGMIKESIDRQAARPREIRKKRSRTRGEGRDHGREGRGRRRPGGRPPAGPRMSSQTRQSRTEEASRPRREAASSKADGVPRVTRAPDGAMGNLGLALKGAGLVEDPPEPKQKPQPLPPAKPRTTEKPPEPSSGEEPPHSETSRGQETSSPPALAVPESADPQPEKLEAPPQAPAPTPSPEESPEEAARSGEASEASFDVAGPSETPSEA